MAKRTLRRIYRSGPLTAEQAARERELRQRICEEYPPVVRARKLPVLSQPLKQAIADSSKSLGQLAKEAGIPETVVKRFVAGEGDLHLAAADQLAHVLGLRLVDN